MSANAVSGTPKFLASTSRGVRRNQSVSRNVSFSENSPSSNTSRNSQPSSSPWIEWGMPAGKYHRSPVATSSMNVRPSASTAVMRALPGDHVRPLGFLVPVHLADPARLQAHVDAGELGRDRQLAHRHLARPASAEQAVVRGVERVLEVRDRARVGLRRDEDVGVLALERQVARPHHGCAVVASYRLGLLRCC